MANTVLEFVKQITVLRIVAKLRLERYGKRFLRHPIIDPQTRVLVTDRTQTNPLNTAETENILNILKHDAGIRDTINYSDGSEVRAYHGIRGLTSVLRACPIQYFIFETQMLRDTLRVWDGSLHERTFKCALTQRPQTMNFPSIAYMTNLPQQFIRDSQGALTPGIDRLEYYDDDKQLFCITNIPRTLKDYYIDPQFFLPLEQSDIVSRLDQCVTPSPLYGLVNTSDLFGLLLMLISKSNLSPVPQSFDYSFHHIGILLSALYVFESQNQEFNDFKFQTFLDNLQYWGMKKFSAGVFKWFSLLKTEHENLKINSVSDFHLETSKLNTNIVLEYTDDEEIIQSQVLQNIASPIHHKQKHSPLRKLTRTVQKKFMPSAENNEAFVAQSCSALTYALCHILDVSYHNFTNDFKFLIRQNQTMALAASHAPFSKIVAYFHSFGFLDPLIKYSLCYTISSTRTRQPSRAGSMPREGSIPRESSIPRTHTPSYGADDNWFIDPLAGLFTNPDTTAVTVCISEVRSATTKHIFTILKVLFNPQQHIFLIGNFSNFGKIEIEHTHGNIIEVLTLKLLAMGPIFKEQNTYLLEAVSHQRIPIGYNDPMYKDVCSIISTRETYDFIMESLLPEGYNTRQMIRNLYANSPQIQQALFNRFPNYFSDPQRFSPTETPSKKILSFVNDFSWTLPLTVIVNPNGLPFDNEFRPIEREENANIYPRSLLNSSINTAVNINSFFIEPTILQKTLTLIANNKYTSQYLWSAPNQILSYLLKFVSTLQTTTDFFEYIQKNLEAQLKIEPQVIHKFLYQTIKYSNASENIKAQILRDMRHTIFSVGYTLAGNKMGYSGATGVIVGGAIGGVAGVTLAYSVTAVGKGVWWMTKAAFHQLQKLSHKYYGTQASASTQPETTASLNPLSSPTRPSSSSSFSFPTEQLTPQQISHQRSVSPLPEERLQDRLNEDLNEYISTHEFDPIWVLWWWKKWVPNNTIRPPSQDFWNRI